jgi:hypothetical protein
MGPPQISNGFRCKPFFPFSSPPQNEVGPSCMPNSKPSCPTLVSPNNDKDKSVIDDVV